MEKPKVSVKGRRLLSQLPPKGSIHLNSNVAITPWLNDTHYPTICTGSTFKRVLRDLVQNCSLVTLLGRLSAILLSRYHHVNGVLAFFFFLLQGHFLGTADITVSFAVVLLYIIANNKVVRIK